MTSPVVFYSTLPRSTKMAFVIIVLLLCAVILLGLFIPLHADEIDWSFVNHRGIQDGETLITLLPQCQSPGKFAKALPITWYPYAYLNHFLFMKFDSLIWVRLLGILRFLLFLISCCYVLKAIAMRPAITCFLFLLLFFLDDISLLMQVNRPEQTIFIGFSCAIACALNMRTFTTAIQKYCAAALFVWCIFCVFPAHPKSIAFLPVLVMCGYIIFSSLNLKKITIFSILCVLIIFAFQSALFWVERYKCPESATMQMIVNQRGLILSDLLTSPLLFIKQVGEVLYTALVMDFFRGREYFPENYLFLPYSLQFLPHWLKAVYTLIGIGISFFQVFLLGYCGIFLLKKISQLLRKGKKQSNTLDVLASASVCSLFACIIITGNSRPFYLVALEVPVLYLCSFLCFIANGTFENKSSGKAYFLISLAILNTGGMFYRYYPFITSPDSRTLTVNWGEYQRTERYSPFEYDKQAREVMQTYESCHLPPKENAKHLVLDIYAYPMLKRTYQPFEFLYFIDGAYTGKLSSEAFMDNLWKYHSDGVLVRCNQIPSDYLHYFTPHGNYCCIHPANIKSAHTS